MLLKLNSKEPTGILQTMWLFEFRLERSLESTPLKGVTYIHGCLNISLLVHQHHVPALASWHHGSMWMGDPWHPNHDQSKMRCRLSMRTIVLYRWWFNTRARLWSGSLPNMQNTVPYRYHFVIPLTWYFISDVIHLGYKYTAILCFLSLFGLFRKLDLTVVLGLGLFLVSCNFFSDKDQSKHLEQTQRTMPYILLPSLLEYRLHNLSQSGY